VGKITRNELIQELQDELQNVFDYVNGTDPLALGNHIADHNNPHQVTKAQVGLGNVSNVLQASKSEFDAHVANLNNPHQVTASQVGAVPVARKVNVGTGLSGGGSLTGDITLSLNLSYTDERYLGKTAKASDSDKLDGYHASDFMKVNDTFLDMGNNDGIEYNDSAGEHGEFYFKMDGTNYRAYHSGNIRYGSSNPSGGVNGDIYIQI